MGMRVLVFLRSVLLAASLTAGGASLRTAFAAELPREVQEAVLTAIRAHYERVRTIEFTDETTGTSEDPAAIPGNARAHVKLEFRVDHPDRRLLRFYSDVISDEPETVRDEAGNTFVVESGQRWITAYDGSAAQRLRAYLEKDRYRKGQVFGYIEGEPPGIGDSWAWVLLPAGPGFMANMLSDASVSGPVEWRGREVYVVDACYGFDPARRRNHTFYVDPQKDYAFCFAETRTYGGDLSTRMIINAFTEVDGIWLPAHYEQHSYYSAYISTIEGTLEYASVNAAMHESDFRFEWPPGTYIRDKITGVEYRLMDEEWLVDKARLDGLMDQLSETGRQPEEGAAPSAAIGRGGDVSFGRRDREPSAPLWPGWWIALIAIMSFLAGITGTGIHYLRKRKRRSRR